MNSIATTMYTRAGLIALCAVVSGCMVVNDTNEPTQPGASVPGAPEPRPTPDPTPAPPDPTPQPMPDPTPQPTPDPTPQPTPRPNGAFTVSLQRTACFGACPMYVVTADNQGNVVFKGERFVAQTGRHSATLTPDHVAQLRQAIDSADIDTLSDCYCERRVTDMPSVIVTVERAGQKKTIRHYTGDHSAPERLLVLQRAIDDIIGTNRWVKQAPQR